MDLPALKVQLILLGWHEDSSECWRCDTARINIKESILFRNYSTTLLQLTLPNGRIRMFTNPDLLLRDIIRYIE